MIDGSNRYPDYKDSCLEWLGEMPAHWEVRRNGRLFLQRNETGFPDLPILEVSLRTGVRVRDFENSTRKQVMTDKEKYKRARRGDIAYNMMRMWQGAVGTAPVDGLISPAYVVARPLPETESRYYQYLFRTGAYMNEVNKFSRGIVSDRNRLYWEDFKQMPSPFPPPDEQAAIVRFLDHADRRIRRYIRAKRQLIALLKEQKQTIIHQAVTRGLDPNVRLKPSGVEWLGDVPEHWEGRRLRYLIHGKLTYGANAAAEHGNADWPRYLRITDFDLDGRLRSDTFRSLPPEIAKDYLVQPGDLLLARSGATVGKAFLVSSDARKACHAGYLIRARPRRSLIRPRYLFAFTQSTAFMRWKDSNLIIATIQNISAEKYASLAVPCPPLAEQSQILRYIDEATAEINTVVERTQREIELLGDFRTRLLAAIVTGELNILAAAAGILDKREDLESFEDALLDGEDVLGDGELEIDAEETAP